MRNMLHLLLLLALAVFTNQAWSVTAVPATETNAKPMGSHEIKGVSLRLPQFNGHI